MTTTPNLESAERKICPDCAEEIQADAKVCRYCHYRFDANASGEVESDSGRPTERKSVAGATILSLVIGGLGQLYLGETRRGIAYLATIGISVVAAVATDTVGPSLIISLIAAIDAYQSAKTYNELGRLQGVTGPIWAMIAVVATLAAVGIATHDGTSDSDGGGETDTEFRLRQNDRCLADGVLSPEQCANIYLR
jgi:TM2 domain-containing membrane protein YozV